MKSFHDVATHRGNKLTRLGSLFLSTLEGTLAEFHVPPPDATCVPLPRWVRPHPQEQSTLDGSSDDAESALEDVEPKSEDSSFLTACLPMDAADFLDSCFAQFGRVHLELEPLSFTFVMDHKARESMLVLQTRCHGENAEFQRGAHDRLYAHRTLYG
eukprot:5769203-Amphidinium_carterae.1